MDRQRRRACRILCAVISCALLAGCAGTPTFPPAAPSTGKRPAPAERSFRASDLAKSDIDIAAEAHLQECLASARLLTEKLYRRSFTPKELAAYGERWAPHRSAAAWHLWRIADTLTPDRSPTKKAKKRAAKKSAHKVLTKKPVKKAKKVRAKG